MVAGMGSAGGDNDFFFGALPDGKNFFMEM
jgi:hypothetical protein